MDLLAHPAQALHALDCIGHLVWLDVLGFVHVESFCVNFVDEGQGDSKLFSSRWVQCEGRQVCQGAIADERVVANRVVAFPAGFAMSLTPTVTTL